MINTHSEDSDRQGASGNALVCDPLASECNAITRRGALICAVGLLTGCQPDRPHWSEEVKLHDGSMIWLERTAFRKSSGFPLSRRGAVKGYGITYPPLGLSWDGDATRQPYSFEIFDGRAYLTLICRDGCPDPSNTYAAQYLRSTQSGRWEAVPESEFPVGIALVNLWIIFWGVESAEDPAGKVLWENKGDVDAVDKTKTPTVAEYLRRHRILCNRS